MADDGFTFVKSRRKKRYNSHFKGSNDMENELHGTADDFHVDRQVFQRRLDKTRNEILHSGAVQHIIQQVHEWCDTCHKLQQTPETMTGRFDIVCYGLGNFTSCVESREQLVCLQELQKLQVTDCDYQCYCYDPKFIAAERSYLSDHKCSLIAENEEGKRSIDRRTVFFMPHCGTALFNNLLWANWRGHRLQDSLIVGNSFSSMRDRNESSTFRSKYQFIDRILPCLVESRVPVDGETLGAFSDTSVMTFQQLPAIDGHTNLGTDCEEPVYQNDDVEIIIKVTSR